MDLKQIFGNLDLRPLRSMIAFIMAGKEPPLKEYTVRIKVPEALVECITPICENLNITIEDVLSKMATEGFREQFQQAMGVAGQKQAEKANPLEGLGLNMPDLSEKLSQLDPLIEKLNNMRQVFDEIVSIPTATSDAVPEGKTNDPPKDPKDSA